jgi:hypothetical protein
MAVKLTGGIDFVATIGNEGQAADRCRPLFFQ